MKAVRLYYGYIFFLFIYVTNLRRLGRFDWLLYSPKIIGGKGKRDKLGHFMAY